MSFKKILLLFFIWRFIDFLIIILAKQFIPYLGFFPYQQDLAKYHLPSFFPLLLILMESIIFASVKKAMTLMNKSFFLFFLF
jgi:hypothetical protein